MKWHDAEIYFRDVIKGKHKGLKARGAKVLLWLLSWPYRAGVFFRNWAYDVGWLRRYYPPVPVVISIGNIVAGGTGKTPLTLKLAQGFSNGCTIAILSRGYRSLAENLSAPIMMHKNQGLMHPASFCGDEPYLLADHLPDAYVFVGQDRQQSTILAAQVGAHIIILDDGMQHRRLARDFEVVVVDAMDPFGHDHFLPRGFLRESRQGLSRAHMVVLNHVRDIDHFNKVKAEVEKYTQAPIVGTKISLGTIWEYKGEQPSEPVPSLEGKRVGIFCGIAQPEYFRAFVEKQGAIIVAEYITPDHISADSKALDQFAIDCKKIGAQWLVCTEKDKVKLSENEYALPIAWFETNLDIVAGKEAWENFVSLVRSRIKKYVA